MPTPKPKPTKTATKRIATKTNSVSSKAKKKSSSSNPANTTKKGNKPGPFFTGVGGRLMDQSERAGRYADIKMQKRNKQIIDFYNSAEYKKNLGKTSKKVR